MTTTSSTHLNDYLYSSPTYVKVGPLTTTWTPEPACLSDFYGLDWITTSQGYGHWLYAGYEPTATFCGPTSVSVATDSKVNNVYYYSPGICPEGYTSACGEVFGVTLDPSETAAQCCPTGYTCQSSKHCLSAISTPVTVTNLVRSSSPAIFTVTPTPSLSVMVWPVKIRYRESDFLDSGSGLSAGAKIGIGVGVPVVVIAVIIAVVLFLVRRKRKRREAEGGEEKDVVASDTVKGGYEKPELADTEVEDKTQVEKAMGVSPNEDPTCELANVEVHEMPNNTSPQELDADNSAQMCKKA